MDASDDPSLSASPPNYNADEHGIARNQELVVRNAAGSLEIMAQIIINEWELLRHRIRDAGEKMRKVGSRVAAVTIHRLWNSILHALNKSNSIGVQGMYSLDAAMILNEMEKGSSEWERPPPKDTINDLRRVLLQDGMEEGVLHSWSLRSPAWTTLPVSRMKIGMGREDSPSPDFPLDGGSSAYQLFNRPMTVDEDFDRYSNPSTFAPSDAEKITSLEQQLAMLTKQMNSLLSNGNAQTRSRPSSRSSRMRGAFSPSPTSDDDGVELLDESASTHTSPYNTVKHPLPVLHEQLLPSEQACGDITENSLPPCMPPSGIPPPPPPLLPSFSSFIPPITVAPPPPPPLPTVATVTNQKELIGDRVDRMPAGGEDAKSCPSSTTVSSKGRSFLDDIAAGGFKLKKTRTTSDSSERNEGDEGGHDENKSSVDNPCVSGIVKPTATQLKTVRLKKTSSIRSPGGTPLQRSRRREGSLGQDGGRTLDKGSFLAAALKKKFSTVHLNAQEDEDEKETENSEESWMEDEEE